MGLLWWVPSLIFYSWWRRRYNIKAKHWEYEMPLMKKDVYINKWDSNVPAYFAPPAKK